MEITSAVVGTVESNPVNTVTISNFQLKIISCLEWVISHLVEVVTYGSLTVVILYMYSKKKIIIFTNYLINVFPCALSLFTEVSVSPFRLKMNMSQRVHT